MKKEKNRCTICGNDKYTSRHLYKKNGVKKMYSVCSAQRTVKRVADELNISQHVVRGDLRAIKRSGWKDFSTTDQIIARRRAVEKEANKECYFKLISALYPPCPTDPKEKERARKRELVAEIGYIKKHDKESIIYEH